MARQYQRIVINASPFMSAVFRECVQSNKMKISKYFYFITLNHLYQTNRQLFDKKLAEANRTETFEEISIFESVKRYNEDLNKSDI